MPQLCQPCAQARGLVGLSHKQGSARQRHRKPDELVRRGGYAAWEAKHSKSKLGVNSKLALMGTNVWVEIVFPLLAGLT